MGPTPSKPKRPEHEAPVVRQPRRTEICALFSCSGPGPGVMDGGEAVGRGLLLAAPPSLSPLCPLSLTRPAPEYPSLTVRSFDNGALLSRLAGPTPRPSVFPSAGVGLTRA